MNKIIERILDENKKIKLLYKNINEKLESQGKKLNIILESIDNGDFGKTYNTITEVLIIIDLSLKDNKEKLKAVFIHELGEADYIANKLPVIYLNEKFFDLLSKYTIGYGEKPWRLIITTLIVISLFAFLYMFCGVKNSGSTFISISLNDINRYSIKELIKRYIDLWYFSTVTFTTLGYGDLTVSTGIGKVLVCLEAFIGITIGSTWASIVIKRMIR